MARDIYPHDQVADVYYVKAVQPYDDKAGKDAASATCWSRASCGSMPIPRIAQARLSGRAGRGRAAVVLQGMAETPFFQKVRGDLVVSLYNQQELWRKFGYEGSSSEHGGYIHRGFDDIDWLPKV